MDKALEQFLNKNYNEDEDLELLALFAAIADINNEQVRKELMDSPLIQGIYKDAKKLSLDKEAQLMLFGEELEIMDRNTDILYAKREGRAEADEEYKEIIAEKDSIIADKEAIIAELQAKIRLLEKTQH